MELIFYPLLSLIAVLALTPQARRLALKYNFVDMPDGRKQHDGLVPPVGGLVIFPIFILFTVLAGAEMRTYAPLYAALILLLAMGTIDDKKEITAWVKFAIQFLAAFLIVLPGYAQLYHLGDLFGFGIVSMGWFAVPLSVFCVALLINSINLMDGLDGLAAGKSVVILSWLLLATALTGQWQNFTLIAVLVGALLGFLYYNMRHPARAKANIFLGDAGSMSLGLVIAWFCIGLAEQPAPAIEPVSVAWIIALPVMDACGQFFRRMKEGRHPFSPDRGHFHHHFINAGFSVGQTTAIILVIGFAFGAVGYLGLLIGVPPMILSFGWVALLGAHMALSLNPAKFIKFLERFKR